MRGIELTGDMVADLVEVSMTSEGTVLFTCRVCGEHCPASEGVPLAQATREFLAMHPVCADPDEHEDGCPTPG